MVSRVGLLVTLVVMTPSLALAHGPSRKKEITIIEINASVEKVWSVVGNYADMTWHPAIAKSEAIGGSEPEKATRTNTFKSGAIFTDGLLDYDAAEKKIGFMTDKEDLKTLPVEGYMSTLTVKDAGGKVIVEWKGAFYRGYMNNDPPPELSDNAAVKAIAEFQKVGLDALKKKIEGGG
ncbi:MAG: SRPBCC family protein [Hyphomicrobium sp.]